MSRKFKITGAVSDYLKRFARGESLPPTAEEQPIPAPEDAGTQAPARAQETTPAPAAEEKCLLVYALTDVGRVRSSNQDAIIEGERLFGVADGMGGHKGGETASSGARDGLVELLAGKTPALDSLRDAVTEVNGRLFRQQQGDEKLSGMGTTLTALWFSDHYVYIGHVGDSRAYLLREGKLQQMTSDHSLVAELVRSGVLTPEQAEGHPMRNVITRAVGTEETVDVDLLVEERQAGDLWLVCSDGLYGMVGDDAIAGALTSLPIDQAADRLLAAALEAGGRDNISLVILLDKEGAQ